MLRSFRLAAFALLALCASSAFAQDRPVEEAEEAGGQTGTAEERRYDDLVARFQKDYFRVTTLVQIVPYVPFEDTEGQEGGFDVSAAWFGVGGRLGENVGYFVRAAFERQPALLEAYVSYGSDDVRVLVGRQFVPFSAEFLVGAANIDFVNRSRAVRQLAPGRSVGAALNANPGGGPVRLRAGIFNATSTGSFSAQPGSGSYDGQSDRGGVLVAGRAQSVVPVGAGTLTLGANVAYNTPDTSDRFTVSSGLVVGGDARLRMGRVLLAGEYLYRNTPTTASAAEIDGGFLTAGYDVTRDDRVLLRFDTINDFDRSNEVLLGYNRALTRAASVQVNVIVPLDDRAEPTQALANFQLAF